MAANKNNNNNTNNNIYKSVRCRKRLLLTKALLHWFMLLTAVVLLLSPDFIVALKDVAVSIPQAVKRGSNALLVCNYDMENDTLYSVKWYKGRREFYRYTPKENPAMKVFGFTTGLNVERNLSNQSHVVLSAVPLNVSGKFTCEISVEAPSFTTAMVSGEMEVVELPEQQASVTGIQPRYRIGDLVDGNCSIKYSKPAANLTWTINGIVVPPHHIKTYQIEKYEEHNLESVVSAINFMVTTQHFIKGQMKLKCTATIFNIYTEEIENIIEEDRPRIMASGRSYDMNAYPYDQHASGDGFEDHNESYLTYYSAADVTSAATPSARSSYAKLNKMFRLYWTKFVTAAKEAFLLTTSSSLLATWPVTTLKQKFLEQNQQQKRPHHHQEQPQGQRQEISQQHSGSTVQATMLIASKFLLPSATRIHATLLTRPTSVQRDVKRSFRSISKRIQLQREIVNEMEINANVKDCKRSENMNTNDDENEDDNGDYFAEYDDDDDSRWRFGEEFMSTRILIAHVDIIEWSIILSLNFALMLKYQKRGTQHQLQQYRQEEAEPEEEKENYDRQQQQQEETQFEQPAEQKQQQLFQHEPNSRSCQNKSPSILDPAWLLCNDFLSSHQVYMLQHIKELKCFYNCQCDGDSDNDCDCCSGCDTDSDFHDVEWQLCLSKQSYIDTFSKWHQKLLCPRQQRRVSSPMLLILTSGQKKFPRKPCNQDRVASATMVTTDVGRMANLTKSAEGNQPKSC